MDKNTPIQVDDAIEEVMYSTTPLLDLLENPEKYGSGREVEDSITYSPKTLGQLEQTVSELVERFGDAELEDGETGTSGAHIHATEYDDGSVVIRVN